MCKLPLLRELARRHSDTQVVVCGGSGIPSLHCQEPEAGPGATHEKWERISPAENSICCGLGSLEMAGGAANSCGQRYPKGRDHVF